MTNASADWLPPYCHLSESGSCFLADLQALRKYLERAAQDEWEKRGVQSSDPQEVLDAGRDAAEIQAGANTARKEADRFEPCNHCPMR